MKINFYKNYHCLKKIFDSVKLKKYFCNKFMLVFIK